MNRAEYKEGNISEDYQLNASEKELLVMASQFNEVIAKAAETLSPAQVANYVYDLVKSYNSFYQNNPILNQDDEDAKQLRLKLSKVTGNIIQKALDLLGIGTVNRM